MALGTHGFDRFTMSLVFDLPTFSGLKSVKSDFLTVTSTISLSCSPFYVAWVRVFVYDVNPQPSASGSEDFCIVQDAFSHQRYFTSDGERSWAMHPADGAPGSKGKSKESVQKM